MSTPQVNRKRAPVRSAAGIRWPSQSGGIVKAAGLGDGPSPVPTPTRRKPPGVAGIPHLCGGKLRPRSEDAGAPDTDQRVSSLAPGEVIAAQRRCVKRLLVTLHGFFTGTRLPTTFCGWDCPVRTHRSPPYSGRTLVVCVRGWQGRLCHAMGRVAGCSAERPWMAMDGRAFPRVVGRAVALGAAKRMRPKPRPRSLTEIAPAGATSRYRMP